MKIAMQILVSVLLMAAGRATAQNGKPLVVPTDSTTRTVNPAFTKDTLTRIVNNDTIKIVPKHNPRTATLHSLILPGWGQAYNHEYWKIPIVYGALGTAAGFFIYNNTWYKRTKKAFEIRIDNDTANFPSIHPILQPLSAQSLQIYRNSFRRDRDYSALYFIILWGLNIADATVFAHLRNFDVSEDLSLHINPTIKANGSAGFSLVLGFKSPQKVNKKIL